MLVYCTSVIIILGATVFALGWTSLHLRNAINALRTALDATQATVKAFETQSDLKIAPLKETINSKDATIQTLESKVSAALERKALAEEKASATQEHLNKVLATLPLEINQRIQEAIQKDRAVMMGTMSAAFSTAGYYMGILNICSLLLQIQVMSYARIEKQGLSDQESALRVAATFLKDIVLFSNRERHRVLERSIALIGLPADKLPPAWTEQLNDAVQVDKFVREVGFDLSPEVAALSSLAGLPFEPKNFGLQG